MNAAVAQDSAPTSEEAALAAARATLKQERAREAEAAAKLEAAVAAHERARQAHDAAVAKDSRLEAAERELIEREAQRLQAAYANGHTEPPALVADQKAQQARLSAQVNVRARAAAREQSAADEQAVREELAVAQRRRATAAEAVADAEAEVLAKRVEYHLGEAVRVGAMLRKYQPDALNTPLNRLNQPAVASLLVQRVLERLQRLEARDEVYVPLNELHAAETAREAQEAAA